MLGSTSAHSFLISAHDSAYALGARDFDTAGALAAMIRDATQPGTTSAGCPVREGLDDYLTLGYVSTNTWGSAARTLEYADGYIVPRKPTGQFVANFSPDGCNGDAFIEGCGGQYSFMVRFNERALFNAIGGSAAAVARLDRHFQQLNAGPCSEFAFMGNEVSLKTPWMYNFAGAPWKTQRVVHRILSELYSNAPAGMPRNDDGGVLSSWVVFASLGLYPEISGVGGLAVATPVFPDAVIHLSNEFDVGAMTNHSWGTQSDAMPSFDVGH
jgi:putative alpha-1,2-mannosidase